MDRVHIVGSAEMCMRRASWPCNQVHFLSLSLSAWPIGRVQCKNAARNQQQRHRRLTEERFFISLGAHLAFSQRALCLPAAIKARGFSPISLFLRCDGCAVVLLLEKAVSRAQIFAPYQRTRCARSISREFCCFWLRAEKGRQSAFLPPSALFCGKSQCVRAFWGFWDFFPTWAVVLEPCAIENKYSPQHKKGHFG